MFELTNTGAHICSEMGSWIIAPTHISTIGILAHFRAHVCPLSTHPDLNMYKHLFLGQGKPEKM